MIRSWSPATRTPRTSAFRGSIWSRAFRTRGLARGTPLLQQLNARTGTATAVGGAFGDMQQRAFDMLTSAAGPQRVRHPPGTRRRSRPLWPAYSRAGAAAGAAIGGSRRLAGVRQLAPGRTEFLGHARQQLQSPEKRLDAPDGSRVSRPCWKTCPIAACSMRRCWCGWASSAAGRKSPATTPAASIGPGARAPFLQGAGSAAARVYGRSDAQAAYPAENPVSPADITATIYHALGIPADLMLHDREERPVRLTEGNPIVPLFG